MHPALTRFFAAVGRRVAIWFVAILVITVIRSFMHHHH